MNLATYRTYTLRSTSVWARASRVGKVKGVSSVSTTGGEQQ
jgi:hypothetical protein